MNDTNETPTLKEALAGVIRAASDGVMSEDASLEVAEVFIAHHNLIESQQLFAALAQLMGQWAKDKDPPLDSEASFRDRAYAQGIRYACAIMKKALCNATRALHPEVEDE